MEREASNSGQKPLHSAQNADPNWERLELHCSRCSQRRIQASYRSLTWSFGKRKSQLCRVQSILISTSPQSPCSFGRHSPSTKAAQKPRRGPSRCPPAFSQVIEMQHGSCRSLMIFEPNWSSYGLVNEKCDAEQLVRLIT